MFCDLFFLLDVNSYLFDGENMILLILCFVCVLKSFVSWGGVVVRLVIVKCLEKLNVY